MEQPGAGDSLPFMAIGGAIVLVPSTKSDNGSENHQPHAKEHSSNDHSKGLRATNEGDAKGANEANSQCMVLVDQNKHELISSDDEQDRNEGGQKKRKRLHRLNAHQTHTLETFFSITAHPDERQKRQLSEATGLEVQQVKFWFQNKRTQMKTLSEREENYRLKVENDILKDENKKLKEAHQNALCDSCIGLSSSNQTSTGKQNHLLEQNVWLKEEVARLHALTPVLMGTPVYPHQMNHAFQFGSSSETLCVSHDDTEMIVEIAKKAMHEFVVLAEAHGSIWVPIPGASVEVLNKVAYSQTFAEGSKAMNTKLKIEATRANGGVMLDSRTIVDFLMDANSYETFFPGLVFNARTIAVYRWPVNACYDGAIQLMTVEMMFPSPMMPTRKCTFVRYCKLLEQGSVAVMDVSLEDSADAFSRCRKMPSGVLIQSKRHNSCMVTVIEHVQVDDTGFPELYMQCLSGLMFGARRWVTSMARQCARMRDVFHVSRGSFFGGARGRKNIMKLADSMLRSFCGGVVASPANCWNFVCGAGTEQDIRVTFRKNGDGTGTAIVCASASFWLPMPAKRTYELLRNNILRSKWDVLVNEGSVREEVRVATGLENDDTVSILHVRHGGADHEEPIMILQNSWYDVSGSFLIYSRIDKAVMNMVVSGQEPTDISLSPSGFAVVPDDVAAMQSCPGSADMGEAGGSVITVVSQNLMKLARASGLSPKTVSTATKLMSESCDNIKGLLLNSHTALLGRN